MEKRSLRACLGKEWLYCDGGTGSLLQEKGLKGGELPERWNLERPEDRGILLPRGRRYCQYKYLRRKSPALSGPGGA